MPAVGKAKRLLKVEVEKRLGLGTFPILPKPTKSKKDF